jgi:hypothetical protein
MARILTPADRPAPPAPTPADPLRGANEAIERLVELVAAQMRRPVQQPVAPVPEPRPAWLEAEIVRDKDGKMIRVIITPEY